MDFRHLIVTCLFSKLRLPFDNQKVKENYAIFKVKIINFAFSKSALTIVSRKRDFIKVGKSLYLPTFSFSSLSYPYYSITALILFILLILRLNNFNPLPT